MKQFYKFFILVIGFTVALAAQAQSTFTLDQCIDYALKNATDAQNAVLDEQIASARVKETVGLGLPQISGSVSLQHNQQLRRFFATKSTAFGFTGLDATEYPNFLPALSDNDVIGSPNFFQLKSSGDAGLNINQLIFNGSYLVGLQAANAYKDLSVKNTIQTKEQIIQNVSKAYYAVLINKERLGLFNSNIGRVDSLLRNTRVLYQNGLAEKIDADRIQVTYNNILVERDKFVNINELSLALLKFQMGYPIEQPLQITGDIQDIEVPAVETLISENDYKLRPDYQVLEANRRLQELNIKNKYAEGIPSISAFANLGYATQSSNVSGLFKTNSTIEDLGTVGPDKWYGYSLFGVSLDVPIFSGLQRNYRVQQEKLTMKKIENGFIKLKHGIDLETKQATINYQNALKTLVSQKENIELANDIARVTKIKYEQGVGSNLEVVDAEDALKQAQNNYYNALYEAMVAKVDLDKAYGKLITK